MTAWTVPTVLLLFLGSAHSTCLPSDPIENPYFKIVCEEEEEDGLKSVTVTCKESLQWANFPRNDSVNVEKSQLIFEDCDFPADLSLLEITKSLNLGSVERLIFEKPRSKVTRQNVRGFRVEELEFKADNFVANEVSDDLLHDIKVQKFFLYCPPGWTTIPDDFFKNSADLTWVLIAERGRLTKIRRNDFAGLKNLQNLSLFRNQIDEIEAGAFDELVSLAKFDIGLNKLTTLPAGLFRNLKNLTTLALFNNEVARLPAGLLQIEGNSVIKNVRLNDNNLTTLPDGFFKNLDHLKAVNLKNNEISSLPEDTFYNATQLEEIDLSENSLVALPPNLFRDLTSLKELDLGENQLVTLPPHLFDSNAHLKILHLHRNALETLPEKIFKSVVTKDSEIRLDHNRLTNLTEGVFFGISNLKLLNMSHNQLHSLGPLCPGAIDKHIEEVDLSHNNLTAEHPVLVNASIFQNCVSIEQLHLRDNAINQIFFDWQFLTLRMLDLENNALSYVDAYDLAGMSGHNPHLNLRGNRIRTVNLDELERYANDFDSKNENPRAGVIELGGNPFDCDCKLISFINYVKHSDDRVSKHYNILDQNFRCSDPPELKNVSLKRIVPEDLKCSYETNVTDDACNGLCSCYDYPIKKVILADCSYMNLKTLPAIISVPDKYSIELNMSGNRLTETPKLSEDTRYFNKVLSLDLSDNRIASLPLETFSTALRELKLHGNDMTRFEPQVLSYLLEDRLLRNLNVSGNKWICDCDFFKIVSKLQTPLRSSDIVCRNKNASLSDLGYNDLCFRHTAIIVGACLLVAFFGVTIGALAAFYYKYQKEIKVWLYAKQWCLWFVTEDELDSDKLYDAFISFSHKDEDFVEKEIVARLEEGPKPYKLCLHYRDWLAGEWIPAQIARSVEESRRTIIILSPNFIESVWARIEFRTAHHQALTEGRARVIIVLCGDVGSFDDFDPELKSYLSMYTYVKWGDPWFWDKLKYALPHRHDPSRRRTRNARIMENHLAQLPIGDNNDKAEIIPMPKISISSNDSAKLLGHDDKIAVS